MIAQMRLTLTLLATFSTYIGIEEMFKHLQAVTTGCYGTEDRKVEGK